MSVRTAFFLMIDPFVLNPPSLKLYDFAGVDCLYRDHLGRRVLLDEEGVGKRVILEHSGTITLDPENDEFYDFTTVVSAEPGHFRGLTICGAPCPENGDWQPASGTVVGCGWVRGSAVAVDDLPSQSVDQPRPFFRQASGAAFEVLALPYEPVLVDSIDVSEQDSLKSHRWQVQNMSAVFDLTSETPDGEIFEGRHASHLNRAHFDFLLPEGAAMAVIRKRYDRFHGRQRARVFVDDQVVGWWYEPSEDRVKRWGWSSYAIPHDFVAGKQSIRVCVDPPSGVPLWSVSLIELWALIPTDR